MKDRAAQHSSHLEEPVSILVVDDRTENFTAMQAVFASSQYKLVQAMSGHEALKVLEHQDFALILLDVQMPGLDGFETARRVRRLERSRHTPIIFVTAIHRDDRTMHRGYEMGAVDYLFKPFDIDVLKAKTEVFVDLYRAKQTVARQTEILRQRELEEERSRGRVREEIALQKYRDLVDSIGHAIIWTADPVTLKMTFVSPSAESIVGYPIDRWLRSENFLKENVHPGDRERLLSSMGNILASGRDLSLNHRLIRADGKTLWFQTGVRLVRKDGAFELRGLSVDVTQQKAIENELRGSRDQLRIIFENVTDGIVVQDRDEKFVYANEVAASMWGFASAAEMLSLGPSEVLTRYELFDEEGGVLAAKRLPSRMALDGNPNPPPMTVKVIQRISGQVRWAVFSSRPLFDDKGDAYMSVTIARDITDTKRAVDALEERVKARTHELQELIEEHKKTEEAIRQSEYFLSSVVENIPNMIFVKDAENLRFLQLNKAGEDLLGFSRNELIGKSDYDLFPKEQADYFGKKDRAVLSGQVVIDIPEEPILTRGHGTRTLHTRKMPIFGPDGKAKYLLGISEDVTERKQAEAQRMRLLQEQAARQAAETAAQRVAFLSKASMLLSASLDYHSILSNVAHLITSEFSEWCLVETLDDRSVLQEVVISHADQEMVRVATDIHRRFPWKMTEGVGPPRVVKTGRSEIHREVSVDLVRRLATSEEHLALLTKMALKSVIVVPLKIREKIVGTLSVARSKGEAFSDQDLELTEELGRRTSIAMENSSLYNAQVYQQKWLESVLNSLPTPLIFLDPITGEATFANRAADLIAGGQFPKVKGQHYAASLGITNERDEPIPFERIPSVRATRGEKIHGSEIVIHTGAGRFSLMVDSETLPSMYGHDATTLMVLQDVTPLKKIEERLHEAVRGRDEFLSICSHELKTPVTSLKLQIQLVARQMNRGDPNVFNPERIRKIVETTDRQVDRMSRLIEDMLDVARISTGRLRTEMKTLDFGNLVRDVLDRFHNELASMRIVVQLQAEPEVMIHADRYRIEQVVANLLTNAMKYGNRKPVDISVRRDGSKAVLSVHDRGIGIARENQTKIFERFERAVPYSNVSGLGLGLYIVHQILEAHHGTIRVQSEVGEGATFVVELPAVSEARAASAS